MNIKSTEEERYEELKNKMLTIIPWNEEKPFIISNPQRSVAKCIADYAKQQGLIEQKYYFPDITLEAKFTRLSVNESIASMCRQRANLLDLAKLFSVFDEVVGNAIRIEDEEYRHLDRSVAKRIVCMHQYISGFCDRELVYPVKITIEEQYAQKNSSIYMIVTIGKIPRSLLKEKEVISDVRVHPFPVNENGESLSNGVTSFDISIPDFVSFFKQKQAILIKNIPDKMLTKSSRKSNTK